MRTAPEAPAIPAPGEPGPGPSAVPSVPLHGPVDVADDSLERLQSAFRALSVEEVDTNPVKRKRERERGAGESMADKGVDHGHVPTSDSTFEGAPSASGLHASPSPTTTTLPTPDPAAAASTPITNPPIAEGTGFTSMPTYPAYGVNPPTTAFPEATTTSEPVASSSAPRWYAADETRGRAIAAEENAKPRKRRTTRKNKARNRFFGPQKPPQKFCAAVWRRRKI